MKLVVKYYILLFVLGTNICSYWVNAAVAQNKHLVKFASYISFTDLVVFGFSCEFHFINILRN